MQQQPDVSELWIHSLRRNNKTTLSWACIFCLDRQIFTSEENLWNHALSNHQDRLPAEDGEALEAFRKSYESESAQKKPSKDGSQPRKPILNVANKAQPEPPLGQSKRRLSTPAPFPPTRTLSAIGALNIGTPRGSDDVTMQDVSEDGGQTTDQPRKRAAIGEGISVAGSASPYREQSASPPPRRSKARPTSAPYGVASGDILGHNMFDSPRPKVERKQLWSPEQDSPLTKSSFDPSNIASIQAQKSRAQGHKHQTKPGKPFQSSPQVMSSRSANPTSTQPPGIFPLTQSSQISQGQIKDETYDIILQPETRPISQEQLVAEVKGIYAGLVMVEAKCIEVDNKQATLAHADPGAQPKLNNEQWQALIALHRTLLHEHHDFFLASQHPSASPALRRLASKYAMPARMWRHGIHSFLELLRHRLPASLDHMLAFIYLAYSMMALLYETVPAFEDTWIECLGDLGRYRMAIEDDDIRDREVWTGVARHWYSKASDKAPTTGRLYHHLAILARPNALQQLFYYSKSLCVEIPFTSARESILTLFEPVLNSNGQGQYRLPPLDTAFVKAHGLLFTGKNMERFEQTLIEFLGLLDNQIGRVTRKFMEQGYHIAITNSVAVLGFASKDNVLMKIISKDKGDTDVDMTGSSDDQSASITSFRRAEQLSNQTLAIVLQRIGDPNVLPFIHVTLVYVLYVSAHSEAMSLLHVDFPWELLSIMLNTLLGSYKTPVRIEDDKFPLPEKDLVRPFPEDYAMRGLLWTEKYFPDEWFNNEKIDEEEKYREVASMTEQRKERILFLACMISKRVRWLNYNHERFSVPQAGAEAESEPDINTLESRTSTFASATTVGSLDRAATWATLDNNNEYQSDAEEDVPSTAMPAAEPSTHD